MTNLSYNKYREEAREEALLCCACFPFLNQLDYTMVPPFAQQIQ